MWKKTDSFGGTDTPMSWTATGTEPSNLTSATPARSENRAVIGATLVVTGDITGSEDLLVEGRIEGAVTLRSNSVTIGKTGHVKGNVAAKTVHVIGAHTGNLFGDDQIVIHQGANVIGDVAAPRVTLEDGAKLKGTIDMDVKPGADARTTSSRQNSAGGEDRTKSEKKTVDQNGELRSSY